MSVDVIDGYSGARKLESYATNHMFRDITRYLSKVTF